MIRLGNKGFTLIELVTFVIIGGIFLPASMVAFSSVMSNFSMPDYQVRARFYAEQKMEELTSRNYADPLLNLRAKDAEPYPLVSGTADYRWTWEIRYIDPTTNPIQDGSNTNYKRISVYVKAPDASEYKVHTIITRRPK